MRGLVVAAAALVLASGCARPGGPALEPFTDASHGFTIARPAAWGTLETDERRRVWFVPAPLPPGEMPETAADEFIVVMTQDADGPLPEHEVRRLAMSLLPMHGVSGFQRTASGSETVVWYRFELTGSTRGREWASVGLLITGPRRMRYVVCAGPLPTWRDRQKVCDEVLRSFAPGDLSN